MKHKPKEEYHRHNEAKEVSTKEDQQANDQAFDKILELCQEYKGLSAERILLSKQSTLSLELKRAVASQLKLIHKLRSKLPLWAEKGVYIPQSLNLEQASGQETALYKQSFIHPEDCLLDLTGGLGVDFWAMCDKAYRGIYVEQDEALYQATCYNLKKLLPPSKFYCFRGDAMICLEELIFRHNPTIIYLDPARRAEQQADKRLYAIEDCSPSVYEVLERIEALELKKPPRLLVKLSPMLDIKHCLRTLPQLVGLTALSLRSEVKELLLELQPYNRNKTQIQSLSGADLKILASDNSIPVVLGGADSEGNRVIGASTHSISGDTLSPNVVAPWIHLPLKAVDLRGDGLVRLFSSSLAQEEASPCPLAKHMGSYLYEGNAAVMKLGLFDMLGRAFDLYKLHPNSHLYTGDSYRVDFPGRILRIQEVIPYQSKYIKQLKKRLAGVQITCRNFPLSADLLRKKLGLPECSETTLVATRLYDNSYVLLLCQRV